MKNKNEFSVSKNPTSSWIYISNHKVEVHISYDEKFLFTIYFHWADKSYRKELQPSSNTTRFYAEDLIIEEIELHEIDRNNIAKCLNEILDAHLR
jgi:hypothetical protein